MALTCAAAAAGSGRGRRRCRGFGAAAAMAVQHRQVHTRQQPPGAAATLRDAHLEAATKAASAACRRLQIPTLAGSWALMRPTRLIYTQQCCPTKRSAAWAS